MFPFDPPENIKRFLMFSGGGGGGGGWVKKEHCEEKGYNKL